MNLQQNPKTFGLYLDGKRLASVTRVLKMAGLTPFKDPPPGAEKNGARQAAMERGHTVHRAIDQTLAGNTIAGDKEIFGYVESAMKWLGTWKSFEVLHVEWPVAHPAFRYGGVVDLHVLLTDSAGYTHRAVVDWKTGAQYDYYGDQLAAYSLAVEQMPDEQCIEMAWAVQIFKDGSPGKGWDVPIHRHWRVFASALTTVRTQVERGLVEAPWDE